jgi:hypothetical protein
MAVKRKKEPACLTDDCGKAAVYRGLCDACYRMAKKRIEQEVVGEQELIDLGLLLPSRRGMRDTAFAVALEKRRQLAAAAGK